MNAKHSSAKVYHVITRFWPAICMGVVYYGVYNYRLLSLTEVELFLFNRLHELQSNIVGATSPPSTLLMSSNASFAIPFVSRTSTLTRLLPKQATLHHRTAVASHRPPCEAADNNVYPACGNLAHASSWQL
jgi:hypothetical protein